MTICSVCNEERQRFPSNLGPCGHGPSWSTVPICHGCLVAVFVRAYRRAKVRLARRDEQEIETSIANDFGLISPRGSAGGLIREFMLDLQMLDPTMTEQLRSMIGERDLSGVGFECPHCRAPIEISRWDLADFVAELG